MERFTGAKALFAFALTGSLAFAGCTRTATTTSTSPATGSSAQARQSSSARNSGWPTMRSGEGMTWTGMAFPTGDAKTSVVGVEKGTPREVRVGQAFDYDIIVTNLTSRQVDAVVVTDQVNANYKLAKSAPEGELNAGVMTWNLGDLEPGESKTIRVSGAAAGEGAINSCASCSYSSVLCAAIPVVSPKLKLVKTGPAEVMRCDPITYNFEVTNTGTGTVNNVRITDALPAGLVMADGKKTIDFNVGALGPGASKRFSASVRADKAGKFENKATAAGDGMTADSAVVSTVVHQPAVTVDVECPENTLIGRELTFKYTVKSTGDSASANTTLVVTLPQGTSFVRADNNGTSSGGRVSWNFGTLAPDDSRTATLVVRSTSAGSLQTTATAQGVCAAAATDSCSVAIEGVPDIGISLRDDTGVRLVGEHHVFTYTVKNQGQVDLTNVTVDAKLSAGLEFVSSTSPVAPKGSGKAVSWNLGTLKVGQETTFTITAKGTAAGEQAIDTVTKSDQLQRTSDASEQVNYIER